MDTTTIDSEFDKLQAEFQDVATTVQGLAAKMQAAEKAGDANAAEWLGDLKRVAQDVDDEQAQVKTLLLASTDSSEASPKPSRRLRKLQQKTSRRCTRRDRSRLRVKLRSRCNNTTACSAGCSGE